jgi:hypothetical protein
MADETGPQALIKIDATADINAVLANPTVPKIYANTFTCSHSFTDITVVLQQIALPVGALLMSFNSAKSLLAQLQAVIDNVEKITKQKIMSATDVYQIIPAAQKKS